MSAQRCRICGEAIRRRGRAWIHAASPGSGAEVSGSHRAEALSDDLAAVAEMARVIRRYLEDSARGDPHLF